MQGFTFAASGSVQRASQVYEKSAKASLLPRPARLLHSPAASSPRAAARSPVRESALPQAGENGSLCTLQEDADDGGHQHRDDDQDHDHRHDGLSLFVLLIVHHDISFLRSAHGADALLRASRSAAAVCGRAGSRQSALALRVSAIISLPGYFLKLKKPKKL